MAATEADRQGQITIPGDRPSGSQVNVRREGLIVHLSFIAPNEYDAIEMYERLAGAIKGGKLRLDIDLV